MAEYRLGNAELLHQAHPRTFFIPSRGEREALGPGDVAKLVFELLDPADDDPAAERMWVRVVEATDGRYLGVLDNDPVALTSVAAGIRIEFGPEHVVALLEDWPLGQLKAIVSKRSHVEDLRPRYACRQEPLSGQDSGWQVLVGDETEAELDDASSALLQPLGFLTDRWPELRPVFDAGEVDSERVWDDATSAYVRFSRDA